MHYAQDSPTAKANLATIESKLAEVDKMFLQFCSEHGYSLSRGLNIWPMRRVWRRQEIDRCMDLVMDVGFQEALDCGFFPEFPWSFYAQGTLHPGTDPNVHILTRPIFEHVTYLRLASVLEEGLSRGHRIVSAMTEREVLMEGLTQQEVISQGQSEYDSYRRSQDAARNPEP